MALGRFLQSLFNSEVMGDEIIAAQERAYIKLQRTMPNEDPHAILGMVWLSRKRSLGENVENERMVNKSFAATLITACVPPPENARALGLSFVYEERPDIISKYSKFEREYDRLMAPVNAAIAQDTLDKIYLQFNPKGYGIEVLQELIGNYKKNKAGGAT